MRASISYNIPFSAAASDRHKLHEIIFFGTFTDKTVGSLP